VSYAPLDRPGPQLTVATATLAAALHCTGDVAAGALEPVLLNPATGVTPDQNFSWNYERAFNAQGRPWCAISMPYDTEGDIQIAGEYLVYAIRTMSATAHRRIAVMGHSQGGMSMRWALRFWPDTRALVDDVIGIAGTNHGTTSLGVCITGKTLCPAASWQQGAGARFIAALNSGTETFAGISYTEIFTHTDEVVRPNSTDATSSSALHTGAGSISNVSTQDICRLDVYEHLTVGTLDPAAYALVMDALNHPGPAVPSRISRSVCLRLYQPGVDPLNAQMYVQILAGVPGLLAVDVPDVNIAGVPEVAGEPPLRCYVFAAGC
jgi:pimeloyl-ACP methyl ester carboxylesterase